MKRLICVIILLVGVYAVGSDARERRLVDLAPADTIWAYQGGVSATEVIQYLHTNIKIFHGPTAQSVLDYFRAWEDSVDVEIAGAVDMEIRQPYSADVLVPEWYVGESRPRHYEKQKRDYKALYYLTVTYREWREETR